ncbi:MAG: pectinesterase family protein [Puniceicoccaceae bacterium]
MKTGNALAGLLATGVLFVSFNSSSAQETAYLSTFAESRVNPPTYANPTTTDADFVIGSTKTHGLGRIGESGMSLDLGNTSAAFVEAAGRIIQVPIELTEPGDVISLVVTFTAESGILQGNTNSQLGFGLYASDGNNPPDGVSNQILFNGSDYTSGSMQDWQGYAMVFENAGGSNRLYVRSAQAEAGISSAQELLFTSNTGGFTSAVSILSGSYAGAGLASGTTCTFVGTLTLVDSSTLSISGKLYDGPEGTGVLLATTVGTASGGNLVTTAFDAVGLGYLRKGVTGDSTITLHTLEIRSNKPTTPAVVLSGPVDLTLTEGGIGSLTVETGGAEPISYAWYRNDVLLPEATEATLAFDNATGVDAGDYYVIVSNTYGSDTSATATVTVTNGTVAPSITVDPTGAQKLVGENHSFSVVANGTSPLQYDWRKDGESLGAADDSSLQLSNLAFEDAGSYTVVVSNGAGSVESEPAILEVWSKPAISVQPDSVITQPGSEVVLSVTATGFPEPTYKWYRNGGLMLGETASTLTFSSVSVEDVGVYYVDAVNAAGVARSDTVSVNVISSVALTGAFPSGNSEDLPPDIQIPLLFDQPVQPGLTGKITIHETDGTLVDTIDMAQANTKRVGGLNYTYDPVLTDGSSAWLVPHTGVLEYGKSYYVLIEPGAILDADNGSFSGIDDSSTIRFSTRASGPAANAGLIRVAADGSADYATVQGAIDHVPAGNTQPVTIRIEPGVYRELLHIPSNKPNITLQGTSREEVTVTYLNNANRNPSNQRASFYSRGNDLVLDSITFVNTTPKGGSQAETLNSGGHRVVVRDCAFYSLQDTLKLSDGGIYFYRSYIEGDVDFLWDDADAFLEDCIIHSVNRGYLVQTRNGQNDRGFVFVRCRLTGEPDAAGTYLGRIDPNVFPYSEAAFIDCAMGPHISTAGWLLNNAATAPTVRFYEYGSTDLDGNPLDLSGRLADSTILDSETAAQYRNAQWVTGFNVATPAWVAALRERDTTGWSFDSSIGWNWGYPFALGNSGFFLWTYAFGDWVYAYPVSADSVYLYVYGQSAGWYWSSRDYGKWAWDFSDGTWELLQ